MLVSLEVKKQTDTCAYPLATKRTPPDLGNLQCILFPLLLPIPAPPLARL